MIRFLLDTNQVSLQERGHQPLLARLAVTPADAIAVSIVTVEELLRGRLAVLSAPLSPAERPLAYTKFWESIRAFAAAQVVMFDTACEDRFKHLRAQKVRIGTRDLRIAATALVHDLTLGTRNRQDFARVPGLEIEDWSVSA